MSLFLGVGKKRRVLRRPCPLPSSALEVILRKQWTSPVIVAQQSRDVRGGLRVGSHSRCVLVRPAGSLHCIFFVPSVQMCRVPCAVCHEPRGFIRAKINRTPCRNNAHVGDGSRHGFVLSLLPQSLPFAVIPPRCLVEQPCDGSYGQLMVAARP